MSCANNCGGPAAPRAASPETFLTAVPLTPPVPTTRRPQPDTWFSEKTFHLYGNGCFACVFCFYWLIWGRWTLTFDRELYVFPTLVFATLWGQCPQQQCVC